MGIFCSQLSCGGYTLFRKLNFTQSHVVDLLEKNWLEVCEYQSGCSVKSIDVTLQFEK